MKLFNLLINRVSVNVCVLSVLAAIFFTVLSGCDVSKVKMSDISGTIKYKGKEIPYGKIIFSMEGTRNGEADIVGGKIVNATTYEPNDGVPVGTAKLGIFGYAENPNPTPAATSTGPAPNPGQMRSVGPFIPKSIIPKKYNSSDTSGLTFEIKKKKGTNVLDLDLK